ncbi:TPM domain-containing protein [Paenibacillus sp. WLX1005]|uniref:TPM domain-containing protein n=1 Tax=Paenibacillus sp. WLX1005 TaxID=3243766 RepID=UPI0039845EF3
MTYDSNKERETRLYASSNDRPSSNENGDSDRNDCVQIHADHADEAAQHCHPSGHIDGQRDGYGVGKLFVTLLVLITLLCASAGTLLPTLSYAASTSETITGTKTLVYDDANLLTTQQKQEITEMANQYGALRQTDFVVYTTNNDSNLDVVKLTEDLYDNKAFGYNQKYGSAAILTLDMRNRDIYLAGFGEAEQLLDDSRLDKIRDYITSDLSSGNYTTAFEKYIQRSYEYMGYRAGVNPDNWLFKFWFQAALAILVGVIIVWIMAYRSGGRVTVDRATYEDASASSLLDHYDRYINTTVTKQKIEKSSSSSGGGGGGGTSSGGHSHSGSRGSF